MEAADVALTVEGKSFSQILDEIEERVNAREGNAETEG